MFCFGLKGNLIIFCLFLIVCCYLVKLAPADVSESWKRSAIAAFEGSIRQVTTPIAGHLENLPGENEIHEEPARRTFASSTMTAIERGKLLAPTSQKRKRITGHQMKVVGASTGWRCASCGTQLKSDFQVDHIIPLHLGGGHSINNFQPLCPSCHGQKNSREQQRVRQLY